MMKVECGVCSGAAQAEMCLDIRDRCPSQCGRDVTLFHSVRVIVLTVFRQPRLTMRHAGKISDKTPLHTHNLLPQYRLKLQSRACFFSFCIQSALLITDWKY